MGRIERSFGGRAPARDKEQERPPLVLETRGHGEGGEREGEGGRRAPPQQGGRHPRKEDEAAVIIPQTHHVPRKESWDVFAPGQLESLLERCRTSSFKGLNLSKDSLLRSLSFNDDSFFDYR